MKDRKVGIEEKNNNDEQINVEPIHLNGFNANIWHFMAGGED